MRKYMSVGLLTIMLSWIANGQIVYELNGAAVTGPNITTNLIAGPNRLRVYDSTGADESVPPITITGLVGNGTVLEVWTSAQTNFPQFLTTAMTPDVINFGGVTFASDADSQALKNITRLAIAVAGSVTGPCNIGQAFRIEPTGDIEDDAHITATAADGLAGFKAIQLVRPSNGSALGNIMATQGSIGDIRVPNGVIGPPPGTAGPTISAANIGTIQAGTINANIVASGALNFLNATVGCLHGTVDAGAIEGRDSTGALDPCVVVVLTDTPAASGVSAHR
jgi:hypothetical protein